MTSDEREATRRCPDQLRGVRLRARRSLQKALGHEQPVRPDGGLNVARLMAAGSTSARLVTVRTAMQLHPDAQAGEYLRVEVPAGDVVGSRISRAPIPRTEMIQLIGCTKCEEILPLGVGPALCPGAPAGTDHGTSDG